MSKKSRLIALEGIDGSGTTTQARLLANSLAKEGFKVFKSAEPTASPIGLFIRDRLSEKAEEKEIFWAMLALSFAADRMYHLHSIVEKALKENDFVILDRYVLSSLVYQGLHLPRSFVENINRYAIKPDLTFVLDVLETTASKRLEVRKSTTDFYEHKDMLKICRNRYLAEAHADDKNIILVDGNGDEQNVLDHLRNVLKYHWPEV